MSETSTANGPSFEKVLLAAVFMLDEAWRRQYDPYTVSEELLDDLRSVALNRQDVQYISDKPSLPSEKPSLKHHVELETVCLSRAVEAFYVPGEDGFDSRLQIPAGTNGTIVSVLGDGCGYEVEFTAPYAALATVVDADIS